jgi:FkbM family methyltransferase
VSAVRACPVDVGGGRRVTFHVDDEALDPISAELAAGLPANADTVALLRALAGERRRILDVGGHLGTVGLACAAHGHRVTLIEASPRNVELLRLSAAPFGDRVTVIHAAVSDRAGTVTFASNGPFGLVADSEATRAFGHLAEVRADTVDDLVGAGRFRRFAAVKLDVEGYEVAALRGMRRTLRHRPPIVVESNGHTLHLYGESPRTLRAALLDLGYDVFEIRGTSLRATTPDALQVTVLTDVLAVRPGADLPDGFEVARAPTPEEIEAEVAAADRALPEQVAYLAREGVATGSA